MAKWFPCMDMHSGGGRKTQWEMFFIEAEDQTDAERIFTDTTGEDPYDVACECCGANFSFCGEGDTLEEATSFWRRGQSLNDYVKDPRNRVLVIPLTREADLI